MVLLAISIWLAVFGDKTPVADGILLSSPKTHNPTTPDHSKTDLQPTNNTSSTIKNRQDELWSEEQHFFILPREQLIWKRTSKLSTDATKSGASRDLFSAHNWNPPPPPQPIEVAVAPPLPFVFMGQKLDGRNWEVYLTREKETFVVREGTTFGGSYRVDKISPPLLELTYLPLNKTQMISIGDTQ